MNNRGFTLIEVMVSISILLIGSLAALQLMARTQHTVHIARNRFVATNVAREGLELARAVRDTNWFISEDPKLSDWAATLCPDPSASRSFTLDAKMVREGSAVGDVEKPKLYIQSGNNEWTHEQNGNSAKFSGFSRTLTVNCEKYLNQTPETLKENPEYIIVTAHVTWQEDNQERSVDLTQKLYNWYVKPL